jgi:hypothetical protein
VGGRTRGCRWHLSARRAAWNRWPARGGDGRPAQGRRRTVDVEVPAVAQRRSLTLGVKTEGEWRQLVRRGASQSRSGAQGGGEGAGRWLEVANDVEAPTTEEMDGVGGFGSSRTTT